MLNVFLLDVLISFQKIFLFPNIVGQKNYNVLRLDSQIYISSFKSSRC